MKVIIPLAGKGTRMRPHTHSKPKPLLCVAGKPGLMHIFEMLKEFDDAQEKKLGSNRVSRISELLFITGYLRDKTEGFIRKHCPYSYRFVEQKKIDGSAGAVKLVEKFVDESVLVIFPDAILDMDLGVIDKLKESESGIIWGMEVEDYQRFGVLVKDRNGYVKKMVEKPDKPVSRLANIGVYFTKDYRLLYDGIHYLYDNNIRPKGEYFFPDALDYMIQHGARFICPQVRGWHDFGKPETLLESNRELLKKRGHKNIREENTENSRIIPPVYIADDVRISGSTVGPHVTIGKGTEIINSTIKESVVGEKTRLEHAHLEDSIIGDECRVSGNFRNLNIGDHCVVCSSQKPGKTGENKRKDKRKDKKD